MTEQGVTQDRLAALEQRVGALVEALCEYGLPGLDARLAALRAPGVDSPGVAEWKADLRVAQAKNESAALRSIHADCHAEKDRVTAALATARRERDAEMDGLRERLDEAKRDRDARIAPLIHAAVQADLATARREEARLVELLAEQHEEAVRAAADASTARRERDEAVGVLRIIGRHTDAGQCWCNARAGEDHWAHCLRARALVAGQGVAQPTRGANGMSVGDRVHYRIDGRCGVAEDFLHDGDADVRFDDGTTETVHWCHLEPERVAVLALRADLATRDAEIAGLKAKLAQNQAWHEQIAMILGGDAGHTVSTAQKVATERAALRARIAELEERPNLARGLIERAVESLEKLQERGTDADPCWCPTSWHTERYGEHAPYCGVASAALADLRTYLGGG